MCFLHLVTFSVLKLDVIAHSVLLDHLEDTYWSMLMTLEMKWRKLLWLSLIIDQIQF